MSKILRLGKQINLSGGLGLILFESILMVVSILGALGINSWYNERQDDAMVEHSMRAFQQEIKQNRQWVEDSYPYQLGIRNVVREMQRETYPYQAVEFRQMIGGAQMVVLRESTWDTVVDTGVLAHMEFEQVSALSLTYSLQRRLQVLYNEGLTDLIRNSYLLEGNKEALLFEALRYLNGIIEAEAQLKAAYEEVAILIQ
ncbi:MAG: hypothetical protein AB9Q22_00445 [Candidatus Reddybacter sp.]